MAEKTSDEIMAEYLLKGARMLSRCCPSCGSPLFEIKGEIRCVVCTESSREPAAVEETRPKKEIAEAPAALQETALAAELSRSLVVLCNRVREEPDPERCLTLMEAIAEGIGALRLLSQ
jgi:Uncharacterized Zn-finger containing protein